MKTSFEKILDSLANGVCAIDDAGIVTVFNTAAEKILNIRKTAIIGRHILDVIPNAGLINVLKTGKSEYGKKQEFTNLTVLTNRTPIFRDNKIVGAVSVFQDITELERVSKELASTKLLVNTLESIIHGAQEWMVVVDKNGFITMISKAYAKFLGVKPENAIGKHVTEIIENTRMHIVARTGVPEIGEKQRIKGKDVIVMRVPLKDDKGEIVGAYGRVMFKDVKEFKNAAQKINLLESKVKYYEEELTSIRSARYNFSSIIGKSPLILQAKKLALKAAQSNSSVLLRGETGTGKELFAHAIHAASKRVMGPFIRVNCAAIPAELLESELFGYEEGAFTGAKKGGKPGKFELADGGTIFLDEIADMPKEMQVKLLRVLQEREIERVGGSKPLPVDIRIITATSQNLEELVALGSFRTDLYYRINVISIKIPSLRERTEDIQPLAKYILEMIAKDHGELPKKCSPEVIRLFKNYNWRGNIRELRNMLEQAVAMSEGDTIVIENIPTYFSKLMISTYKEFTSSVLSELKNNTEKMAIIEALKTSSGNKSRAAKLLGIHRVKLYDKLKKHKIPQV